MSFENVNLDFVSIKVKWPQNVSSLDLRSWVLKHLNNYGEPLRWAITDIQDESVIADRLIQVEAVLIISPN